MAKIKLPRSGSAIGYIQDSPESPTPDSSEYVGLALRGLGTALKEYAKFEEKENERQDMETLSRLNLPGQIEGILDNYFNSMVTLEDGSVDYNASMEKSDTIRSSWDTIVPIAANEIQQLINGLPVNDKLKSSLLSVSMGQMDEYVTDKSNKIAVERIERDNYFYKELLQMIEDGLQQVSAGEGSNLIKQAVFVGDRASEELNDPELISKARSRTNEARRLWVSSYPRSTEGQLELSLDIVSGVMGESTPALRNTLDVVVGNLSGTSSAGGSTAKSSSESIINSMQATTPEQFEMLEELKLLAPEDLKPHIQFAYDKRTADNKMSSTAAEAISAQDAITEEDFHRELEALSDKDIGKAGIDQIDKSLFASGSYNNIKGEGIWRWFSTYSTLNNSIEVPPRFGKILSNYLKTNTHEGQEWNHFAKVAELYIQNNLEVEGISKEYKTKLKNFLTEFNLGTRNPTAALINASSEEVVNPAEFSTTAEVEIDGSGYFTDTAEYSSQVKAMVNGWGPEQWTELLPSASWWSEGSRKTGAAKDRAMRWALPLTESKSFKEPSEEDKQTIANALSKQFGYLAKSLTLKDKTVTDQEAFGMVYNPAINNLKASMVVDDRGDKVKIWLIRPQDLTIKNSKNESIKLNPNVPDLIRDVLTDVELPDTQKATPLRWINKLAANGKLIPMSGGTYQIGIMENDVLKVARDRSGNPIYFNFNQAIVYKIHSDEVADADEVMRIATARPENLSNGDILEAGKYHIGDILATDNTGYYAGLPVPQQIQVIEDFLISGTGDPNPLSEESLSSITELKGFNDLPDEDRLVVLKQLVANYQDKVSQPSFIGNPVTRPYFEKEVRNIAEENKARIESQRSIVGNTVWSDNERPVSIWSEKDVAIAYNRAREKFLDERVNKVGEGRERKPSTSFDRGALLKEIREGTTKFKTEDLYYGSFTTDSIIKRVVSSVEMGIEIPVSTQGNDHKVIEEVLSIIEERKNRPELNGTMSPVGDKKNPNRHYFELVGGTKQLPAFFSNDAIADRIKEPIDFNEAEGPWFNLRELYRQNDFKPIPKSKLIKSIYAFSDEYSSTPIELFDLVRAASMDLFHEDDEYLVFAMSDSRFSKFLWSLVGKKGSGND